MKPKSMLADPNAPLTPLEALKERLSSPRLRSPGTIKTYMATGAAFLAWMGPHLPPTDSAYRRYFTWRRENGVAEGTLRKEFFQIQKLADANGWSWPFEKDDTPQANAEPHQPTFTIEQVKQLILSRDEMSREDRFYLAISTTWGSRREELARIEKRDYNETSIVLHIAKRNMHKKHLIPPVFFPIFEAFHPSHLEADSLGKAFHRICERGGVPHPSGYGWHSIRRMVKTALEWELAAARLPLPWAADFLAWSKTARGIEFSGSAMAGLYDHSAEAMADPWYQEKKILEVHPFVNSWQVH